VADYRLYGMGESGNAYKAALMLNLCGLDWECRFVDYFNDETKREAYRRDVNELGEIPVLEYDGGRLSQSGAILTFLADRTGKFGGRDETEKLEILRWILFDNHKFTSYFATLRFMIGIQKTGQTPVTEFLRARVMGAFGIVEKHLANSHFILGDRPTIADISIVGYLFHPEETGIDRAAFPNINAWTGRIAALPGWAGPYELMPRGLG